ncbi:uncharacterized protein LOC131638522 [Vicia villosa]|uniref:uncharacterized protein LOC131638522 n=1 Tax=Vicia villosa TaxID=3911 RepID=UPI00273BA279|nr:uncharacterized protein LOC131638522 [Vicia villosa]
MYIIGIGIYYFDIPRYHNFPYPFSTLYRTLLNPYSFTPQSSFSSLNSNINAQPIEAVKDINYSKDLWKIVVRCKHMWTVTSSSNKQHLELILIDSYLDMIQAFVPPHLVSKYLAELAIGGKTKLPDIPVNYLNIIGLNTIVDGKFQSNLLVDVVGGVTEIVQTQINVDNNKSKAVFIITDMSKSFVQCTLWGQLALQFYEYYKTHNEEGNVVVLLQNARIKGTQGGFPLNVSNTWNGTKLTINDVSVVEISKLKESLQNDLPKLSQSTLQVETTQTSQYSEFDKFICNAEILSLAEISSLQYTTCVTVVTLNKFEAGQAGWYYDGFGVCTKGVSLKDGNLKCYANHIMTETVSRYKLEILGIDGKFKARFVFWDSDCVKLIGKSALQMKIKLIEEGEDNPWELPFELDALLKMEWAIRAIFHPKFGRLSVIGFKYDEETRKKMRDNFKFEEVALKLGVSEPFSQEDLRSFSIKPLSASADYDPSVVNLGLTPSKRTITDIVEDVESVQLSSTKMTKPIKEEKLI